MSARHDQTMPSAALPATGHEPVVGPLLDAFPNEALPHSMDFNALLAEGIRYTQAMSSDQWTDYNEHDPGLTILEQLCYALTDLGFRSQYKVEDLLADEHGAIARDTLFTGGSILTTAPLTANDYRKIVYDRVHGLKNFWLEPVEDGLPGLYRGLIEKFKWGEDRKLVEQVSRLLRAHRTLGEDVVSVQVLKQQPLRLSGWIQLMPGCDADEVVGEVLFNLDLKLVPGPVPMAIDERIAAGEPLDAIYEGPSLKYGMIDAAGLADRPRNISLQQVADIVQKVAGVHQLSNLHFLDRDGSRLAQAILALDPDSVPFIDVPSIHERWPFEVLDASGRHVTLDRHRVERFFLKFRADGRAKETAVKLSTDTLDYRRLPYGRYLDIERYYSIQHQFPVTYGLSRRGIPDYFHWQAADAEAIFAPPDSAAGVHRTAQVKQLRAYLLLFEQVLANAFSQLANVRRLFSLQPPAQSYFFQPLSRHPEQPHDPPHTDTVLRDWHDEENQHDDDLRWRHIVHVYRERHVPALASHRIAGEARARWLAHVIAERSTSAAHYSVISRDDTEFMLALLNEHGHIIAHGLQRFPTLAEARHEIHQLVVHMRRVHAEHRVRRYIKLHRQGAVGMRVIRNGGQVMLSAYWPCLLSERTARMDAVLELGSHHEHYAYRRERNGQWRFVLIDRQGEQVAEGQMLYESEEEARRKARAVAHLIKHIGFDNRAYLRHVQLLPDHDESLPHEAAPDEKLRQDYVRHLKQLMAQFDAYPQRRNAFLDHLLARFNERFDDELLQSFDPRPANRDGFLLELSTWKSSFLRTYPLWSARRHCAFNYGRRLAHEMPFGSGLEHRLYSLLGIGGAHYFARHPVSRPRLTSTWLGYSMQQGVADLFEPGFEFSGTDPDMMARLLKYGTDLQRYRIEQAGAAWRLYFSHPEQAGPQLVMEHHDGRQLQGFLERLIAWLQRHGSAWERVYEGEGLYAVEHLLLRPLAPDTDHEHQKHAEFFTYRLSVLFPAWPMRFRNPAFRKHAEALVAENCPAHMVVDCHWVEFDRMRQFEDLYAVWAHEKYLFTHRHRHDTSRLDHISRELRRFLQQLPEHEPS